jgi:hypothetical protein
MRLGLLFWNDHPTHELLCVLAGGGFDNASAFGYLSRSNC